MSTGCPPQRTAAPRHFKQVRDRLERHRLQSVSSILGNPTQAEACVTDVVFAQGVGYTPIFL
jgi:hypothetical protein